MKKLFLLLLLSPLCMWGGENEQRIEADIKSAIVYLNGAEVMHSKQITLQPGRNELRFVGISSYMIPKSIQFTASGSVSLLAISNRIDYLYGQIKSDARVRQLSDSLDQMNDQYGILGGQIDAFTKEKQLLDANQRMSGTEKGISAAELKLSADFYRSRITEINTEIIKLQRRQNRMSETINRLSAQLNRETSNQNPPMAEITVLVNVTGGVKLVSDITLRYVVSNAGWAPSYDLVAEDVGKPIDLKYRAKVFNRTDVAWKDVKLRLSTGDPMKSAVAPQPERWVLNFQNNDYLYKQQAYGYYSAPAQQQSLESQSLRNNMPSAQAPIPNAGAYDAEADEVTTPGRTTGPEFEEIQISELSAEFDIKSAYDIPADGQPYIVDVTSYNLNASFQYRAVPKLDRDAFLMARITGWEELDLVEGPANVYFGGTYVGQSYIYTRSTNDTLDLSFGRDQKLLVTRNKLKEMNSEKPSGTTKKESYSYEITVKNTRKASVSVELIDQIPVSQDAEIVVETQTMTGGVLDPATGLITWKLTIPPGESVKVVLSYSVKYPKNKTLNTRNYKRASRAKW
ncbi:MAG: DUF4139 domain-containing protein [Bacteroidia bacterium]|jgi:uncharacterized protein (TIGR02231 family)|nr:DUF4139 domain-containing protein [Bacteroidia bacterium]